MPITDHDDNEYSIDRVLGDRKNCDSRGLMPGEAIGCTPGPDFLSVNSLRRRLSDDEYRRLCAALDEVIKWITSGSDDDDDDDDDVVD